MVRYRLERRNRRRFARGMGPCRPVQFIKLQAQRRITRRTHPAARAITTEPGGKFVAPGRGIARLGVIGPIVPDLIARGPHNGRRPRLGFRITLLYGSGNGLRGATANVSTQRTIHESQSLLIELFIEPFIELFIGLLVEIVSNPCPQNRARPAERTTGRQPTGILALFATLPRGQRRANFTMPRPERKKGRYVCDGRSSSVDFFR
jgi:hypothetical protein